MESSRSIDMAPVSMVATSVVAAALCAEVSFTYL
jgi:hypothetical protein